MNNKLIERETDTMSEHLQLPPEQMIASAQEIHTGLVSVSSSVFDLQNATDAGDAERVRKTVRKLRGELDALLMDTRNLAENTESLSSYLETIERDLGLDAL